jgi:2'-5' RNA ligase
VAGLFFAIWPDPECARALEALSGRIAAQVEGKAVPASKLHMTLAFLGSIDAAAQLAAIDVGSAVRGAAFEATLDRLGSFRNARVAWAGMSRLPRALSALQASIDARLRQQGFPLEERPFAPHVTLARKTARTLRASALVPITWQVDAFTLVRSEPGTGRYAIEHRWELKN